MYSSAAVDVATMYFFLDFQEVAPAASQKT